MLKKSLLSLVFLLMVGAFEEASGKIFLKINPEKSPTLQEKKDISDDFCERYKKSS